MRSLAIILLIFIAAYLVGRGLQTGPAEDKPSFVSGCDPSLAVCEVKDHGVVYRIQFKGEPSPLVPFEVWLEPLQNNIQGATLTFDMQGMDMGYNHYPMSFENGHWQVRVILPVCTLARSDWQLRVRVDTQGGSQVSQFEFMQPE